MGEWFGASSDEIVRVAASTFALYVSVLVALRIAGRRTVSQMSAFDFVVTIAIGSLIASTVLTADPSYLRGLTGLVTLLLAQQMVAVVRQRIPRTRRILDFQPQPIYADGEMKLRQSPFTAQLTEAELLSKLRRQGIEHLDEVSVVILEPDGRISVLRADSDRSEPPPLW